MVLNRFLIGVCAMSLAMAAGTQTAPQERAEIVVHAGHVTNRVTSLMTGACLEDVNHEVYGGIYSQMLYGESFQEPPPPPTFTGFRKYGGDWSVVDGELRVSAGDGPKLVATAPPNAESTIDVEVFLPTASAGVAGLILQVRDPGTGADRFQGYEVALGDGFLRFGRHRNNWEHIGDYPCDSGPGRWMKLHVRVAAPRVEISLGGRSILEYEDKEHPLRPGAFGLRTWQRDARFRNMVQWRGTSGHEVALQEEPNTFQGISGMWRPTDDGRSSLNGAQYSLVTEFPFTGRQSQRIAGGGVGDNRRLSPSWAGLENRGLNRQGISFVAGKPYEGRVWVRRPGGDPVEAWVSLQSSDGSRIYAETRIHATSREWQAVDFTLVPKESDRSGRFAITLKQFGILDIGYARLRPGPWGRFKGLPVRRDVARALIDQGITVLRYGGSMVNALEYRWKKMVGPRDRRPPYHGTWYPYSSNGWGIPDFLSFCEAAGFQAIPAFNMDETPQDMAEFVEYANGPADSPWGRRRAEDGHPKPYGLRYVELGNEEAVNEEYWRRFEPMAQAMWAKDPSLILVVGDFAYDKPIVDPTNFDGAPNIRSLAAHKKILDLSREQNREVWFDVHVWNDEVRQPETLGGIPTFIDWLGRLSPGARFKVVVFELNAVNHAVRRSISNAHAINQLERIGDHVPIVCSANCLQVDGHNDSGWDQGLLFLNPWMVWGQPPYYVTQLLSRSYLPNVVESECHSPGNALDVTSKASADGRTLQLQVVNVEGRPVSARITLDGFRPTEPSAHVEELAGPLAGVNTAEKPTAIVPTVREIPHGFRDGALDYTFPPYSFTLLRLR